MTSNVYGSKTWLVTKNSRGGESLTGKAFTFRDLSFHVRFVEFFYSLFTYVQAGRSAISKRVLCDFSLVQVQFLISYATIRIGIAPKPHRTRLWNRTANRPTHMWTEPEGIGFSIGVFAQVLVKMLSRGTDTLVASIYTVLLLPISNL